MVKTGDGRIVQCGRLITEEELEQIRETVKLFFRLSRNELGVTVCEHLGWFTASGKHKVDACLRLLLKLEGQGEISLPEKRIKRWANERGDVSFTDTSYVQPDIVGTIKKIGPITLKAVRAREDKERFNEYISRYHYLGYKKPFGFRLRYFIESERGLLGCILLSGPAKSIGVRDRWIGWTENQRLRNLSWVINNSRFLLFPWVRVKNLGSHVLGEVGRRVVLDWEELWGYKPVLLETFVDPAKYEGICYKAANWQYLGMTTGQGLVRDGKHYKTTPKKIFVKPLTKDFRRVLCSDELVGRAEI